MCRRPRARPARLSLSGDWLRRIGEDLVVIPERRTGETLAVFDEVVMMSDRHAGDMPANPAEGSVLGLASQHPRRTNGRSRDRHIPEAKDR